MSCLFTFYRLFQCLVLLTVVCLFIYLILYSTNFSKDYYGPDFQWLKTRNMSEFVRPDQNTVNLEPSAPLCKAEDKLRLVVVVYSAPAHYERRRVIRKTWGSAFKKILGVRMIFMLGHPPNKSLQKTIVAEADKYDDLVQEDFVDTFANLTLKATFMFKWLTSNDCLSSKFMFKTDDDNFVNPKQLWATLEHSLLHSATTKSLLPFFKRTMMKNENPELQNSSALSESIDYLVSIESFPVAQYSFSML